ncbi:hypothetical protein KW797_00970 [Candidatus Parcubacteria bacterium]|nr:hypothetical protein [Candidatus Parcubacteria bacterium]
MRKYIAHLHKKPEHVRRRMLYVIAPALTFLIAAGWLSSLTPDAPKAKSSAVTVVEQVSPSALAKEDSITLWEGVRTSVAGFLTRKEDSAPSSAAVEVLPATTAEAYEADASTSSPAQASAPGFWTGVRAGWRSFLDGAQSAL